MTETTQLVVTLPKGRRVDVQLGAHTVHTDQPVGNGGEDSAPSPFDLFLASIGACAGIFVQGFCAQRSIPTEGVRLLERPQFAADGTLSGVDLEVQVPPDFPEKYLGALINVVNQCSVKRALKAQPEIRVQARRVG